MESNEEILGPRRFSDGQLERRLPLTFFERTAQARNLRQENLLHKKSQVLDRQKLQQRKEMDRRVEALKQLSSRLKERQEQLMHSNKKFPAQEQSLMMDSNRELLSTSKHLRDPRAMKGGKSCVMLGSTESLLSKSSKQLETALPILRFKGQTCSAAHECEPGAQGRQPKQSNYMGKHFLSSSYPPNHRIKSTDEVRSGQPESITSNLELFAAPNAGRYLDCTDFQLI
jgi:hypothetical protein